jgi:hypothetical protein
MAAATVASILAGEIGGTAGEAARLASGKQVIAKNTDKL